MPALVWVHGGGFAGGGLDMREADQLAREVAARTGGMRAADILLRRLWPERRGRPVALDLPDVTTPAGPVGALGAVARAVAHGDLGPEEGRAVAGVLEAQRRAVETLELGRRIEALEAGGTGR